MSVTPHAERFSEKQRGRPKGAAARRLDSGGMLSPIEGCRRTQLNTVVGYEALRIVLDADAETQRAILGQTGDDIDRGKARLPKGWWTAATEIGRFVLASPDEEDFALDCLLDARRRSVSWSAIRDHFRQMRIGKRTGSEAALLKSLARAIDEFRQRYPGTADAVVTGAVARLVDLVNQ